MLSIGEAIVTAPQHCAWLAHVPGLGGDEERSFLSETVDLTLLRLTTSK